MHSVRQQKQYSDNATFSRLVICPDCKADEMLAPDYAEAERAERQAVRDGNVTFVA